MVGTSCCRAARLSEQGFHDYHAQDFSFSAALTVLAIMVLTLASASPAAQSAKFFRDDPITREGLQDFESARVGRSHFHLANLFVKAGDRRRTCARRTSTRSTRFLTRAGSPIAFMRSPSRPGDHARSQHHGRPRSGALDDHSGQTSRDRTWLYRARREGQVWFLIRSARIPGGFGGHLCRDASSSAALGYYVVESDLTTYARRTWSSATASRCARTASASDDAGGRRRRVRNVRSDDGSIA
jgi:hypothetical protein